MSRVDELYKPLDDDNDGVDDSNDLSAKAERMAFAIRTLLEVCTVYYYLLYFTLLVNVIFLKYQMF